jgi:3-deoxy-7-phosphoheptulonate synthase
MKVLGSYPQRTARSGEQAEMIDAVALRVDPAAGSMPGVAKACPAVPKSLDKRSYRLVTREQRPEDSTIRVGNVSVGGDRPVVIAGPCSVESREQVLACARVVRECGGDLLRGGCFKPRTSPYSFQGLGYEGLELLADAGRQFDLPIVTEVLHPRDLHAVTEKADMIQIGARNMQNFPLLREVGKVDRPVFLKRGMMATVDEWLAAAEYILAQGNQQVVLCERGIRTFETSTRFTLDLSAIPVVRERTHLPILVDPSHACGKRRWVSPLAECAIAAGANGIMVEIHPDPDKALCDGPQSLDFEDFAGMMSRLRHRRRTPTGESAGEPASDS